MDNNLQDINNSNPFSKIPIEVTVSVGRAHPLVKDLLLLSQDSVLELDRSISDPVELFVGDRLFAKGELQELDGDNSGQLSVRLTEVVSIQKGM